MEYYLSKYTDKLVSLGKTNKKCELLTFERARRGIYTAFEAFKYLFKLTLQFFEKKIILIKRLLIKRNI